MGGGGNYGGHVQRDYEPRPVWTSLRGEMEDMSVRVCVCVYYCRTYYKAVCGGGGGQLRTCAMRYEACVD